MADTKISGLPSSTTPLAGTEVVPIVQSSTTKQVSIANLTAGRPVTTDSVTTASGYTFRAADNTAYELLRYVGGTNNPGIFAKVNESTRTTTIVAAGSSVAGQVFNLGTEAVEDILSIAYSGASAGVTFKYNNLVQGTAAKGINFTANTPASGMTSQLLNWYEEGTFTPTVVGSSTAGTATYSVQEGVYTRIGRCVYYSIALSWSAGNGTGSLYIGGLPFTSRSQTNYMMGSAQPGSLLAITANNIVAPQVIVNDTQIRIIEVPVGGGSVGVLAYDGEAALNLTGFYFV
jgi:hypothetical protein